MVKNSNGMSNDNSDSNGNGNATFNKTELRT